MEAFYVDLVLVGTAVGVGAFSLIALYVLNRRFERRWGKD